MKRMISGCLAMVLAACLAGCHEQSAGSGGVSGTAGDTATENAGTDTAGVDTASSASDTTAASGLKAYDPCELITKADAEAAFGWTLKLKDGTDKPANAAGQRICGYESAPGSQAPEFFLVQIDVTSEVSMAEGAKQGGVTAETQYENIKKAFEAQGITEVTGLGDKAWDGGCGLGKGGLHVLVKGKGVYFTISSIYSSKGCTEEEAIWRALSEKLISRL